jgi:hypothetical protein
MNGHLHGPAALPPESTRWEGIKMRETVSREVVFVESRTDAVRNFDFISSLLYKSIRSHQNVPECLNICGCVVPRILNLGTDILLCEYSRCLDY